MSDYEVTLVHDNSECVPFNCVRHIYYEEALLTYMLKCAQKPYTSSSLSIQDRAYIFCRQEFYVRFKGPDESILCSDETL